jgi:hypothetical protein
VEVVRAAIAVVFAIAERARAADGDRFWWKTAVTAEPAEFATEMGFLVAEVEAALQALFEAGVLVEEGKGITLSPDVVCEQPAYAEVDWASARERLVQARVGVAAGLGVLRELVRLKPSVGDSAFSVTLGALQDATLFSRTTVADALAGLERAGVVERGAATRQGVRLRLILEERQER